MQPLQFAQLTKDLRSAGTQLDQLKVLIRRWNTLRDLSAGERKQLALELGWDSAEALVEKLGQRGGLSPSKLFKAVREAERNQPGALAEIFSGLRDPGRRKEAADRGLTMAQEVVRSLHQVSDAKQKARVAPPPKKVIPPPPPGPETDAAVEAEPQSELAPPPRPIALETVPAEVVAPEQDEEEPVAEPAPRAAPEPSPPAPAEPPQPDLWAQQAKRASDRLAAPVRETDWRPAAAPPATTLMRRFRDLAQLPDQLEKDAARRVLEQFPEGWSRRRALTRLLAAGKVGDAETVAGLIAMLPRESDRFWCAATWLDAGQGRDLEALRSCLSDRSWKRLAARPAGP